MHPHPSQLVVGARAFAARAHDGQVRKYTGEPYVRHVEAVADAVAALPGAREEDVVIALLHDVVEDTAVTYTAIEKAFGTAVATGVWWLTDTATELGNRATRKMLDRNRLAAAPMAIQNIKLCDIDDNTSTIMQHDPEFGERFMGEKYQLLMVMGGTQRLWQKSMDMIKQQPFFDDPEWRAKYVA